MRTAAEQFEAEEALAAECLAERFAIEDAGGWAEYVKIRDLNEDQPMTDETTARDRAIEVDHIVASIDWEPTCLPGKEQHAIVEQVLRLRALAGAPTADAAIVQAAREFAATEGVRIDAEGHALYQALRRAIAAAPEGVDAADELAASSGATGSNLEEPDAMDLEAQGEMADQLAAAQAAIGRVRPVVREALRLLDDWQTAEELGTVEEWAVQISETLRALDGDTTEEQR